MIEQVPFKYLILRAVLRHVSPMVIRQVAVSDQTSLPEFNDILRIPVKWAPDSGDAGRRRSEATLVESYSIQVAHMSQEKGK